MKLLNQYEINTLNTEGIEILFDIFHQDFIETKTYLTKGSISYAIDVRESETCPCPFSKTDKPERFWHVITRDKKNSQKSNNPCPDEYEKKRVYDKSRAKRLHWIKPFIENWQNDSQLVHYYQKKQGKVNLIIWNESLKFLIVIRKLSNNLERFLVASYNVFDDEKHRFHNKLDRYNRESPTGDEWF